MHGVPPSSPRSHSFVPACVPTNPTTLNYADLESPFGGGRGSPGPGGNMAGGDGGHVTPGDAGNPASVPTSKSAFIELQQHSYNAGLRTSSYHPHHYQSPQPGGTHHHSDSPSFASPRTALSAYPFPTMHQNSYASYHLGSYASQCTSPTKDGKLDRGLTLRSSSFIPQ